MGRNMRRAAARTGELRRSGLGPIARATIARGAMARGAALLSVAVLGVAVLGVAVLSVAVLGVAVLGVATPGAVPPGVGTTAALADVATTTALAVNHSRPTVIVRATPTPSPDASLTAGDSRASPPGRLARRGAAPPTGAGWPTGAGRPVAGADYAWPLVPPPVVLTPFGAPDDPFGPGHRGVDLAGVVGQAVLAARGGTVVFAGPVAGFGVVSVQHDDGLRTTYEPVVPVVRAGATVAAGDVLGTLTAGHRGCRSTCLHWGVRRDRLDYVDPLVLLLPPHVRLLPVPEPWPDG